jgi:hypothetical protein
MFGDQQRALSGGEEQLAAKAVPLDGSINGKTAEPEYRNVIAG